MSSKKYSIEEVLNFCKSERIVIVNREDLKNEKFLAAVQMSIEEAKEEIRNLRKEFLYRGPFLDKDRPNNYLYEFHKRIKSKWCYIKLTIDDKKNVVVKVISLHESRGVAYA